MDNITKAFHELNVALRRAGLGVVCMLMLWCVSALEAKATAHIAPPVGIGRQHLHGGKFPTVAHRCECFHRCRARP